MPNHQFATLHLEIQLRIFEFTCGPIDIMWLKKEDDATRTRRNNQINVFNLFPALKNCKYLFTHDGLGVFTNETEFTYHLPSELYHIQSDRDARLEFNNTKVFRMHTGKVTVNLPNQASAHVFDFKYPSGAGYSNICYIQKMLKNFHMLKEIRIIMLGKAKDEDVVSLKEELKKMLFEFEVMRGWSKNSNKQMDWSVPRFVCEPDEDNP